jgi:hypothetical protein
MKIEKVQDIKSQKGYKFNNQFFVAYEGNSQFDANNQDYLACLEFIKNGGKLEPEFTKEEYLKRAKDEKLAKLEAFILAKKTEPFTSHLAPEIIDGFRIGAEVKFYWYVDDIPNSNLTSESVLAKCTMDYVSCNDFARKTGNDYLSEKTIYNNCIKQKIVPYPTKIIKKDAEGKDKEQAGVVNIFPVAFSLAQHIQTREISNNILLKIKQSEINACKTVEEVEAIKFE